jgi:hypothetical protein
MTARVNLFFFSKVKTFEEDVTKNDYYLNSFQYMKEVLFIAQISRQASEQEKLFSKADFTPDDRVQKEG